MYILSRGLAEHLVFAPHQPEHHMAACMATKEPAQQHVRPQKYSLHVFCLQLLCLQVFEEGQPVKCNALAYWEFKVGYML